MLSYQTSKVRLFNTVFFNLFSEVEPFAAILIAHGTRVFFGGTPEARRAEIRGHVPRARRGFWGKVQRAPSPPARGLVERCTLSQLGFGAEPRSQIHFGPIKSLENASSGRNFTDHRRSRGTLGYHWWNP